MKNYHINIFYSKEDDGYIADIPDFLAVVIVCRVELKIVAVVIDKKELKARYPTPVHPYHLAMGFLLQRYCGFLNHINRCGDVMAESRGGHEDRLLKDSYARVYERGVWMNGADFFQQALTSKELKVKPKSAKWSCPALADSLTFVIHVVQ